MENIFRIALLVSGIINFIPSFLAFMPSGIPNSYGIPVPEANFELLLRHRAVMFAIVGGVMIFSAVTKKYYDLATTIGLVSMISFIVLYFLLGDGINAQLRNVMLVDVGAIVLLIIGWGLHKFR